MSVFSIVLRGHRWWMLIAIAVAFWTAIAAPNYAHTYSTEPARAAAVASARGDMTLTVLYGRIDGSGTPAQLAVWELGALTGIALAVLAVLMTASLSRRAVDSGELEAVRTGGCGRAAWFDAAAVYVVLVAAATAAGGAASLLRVGGLGLRDSAAYGAVLGSILLAVSALTAVVAQLVPDSRGATWCGLLLVVASFLARGWAETSDVGVGEWVGPLGLRSLVHPCADPDWLPVGVWTAVAVVAFLLARVMVVRRDLGSGMLPPLRPKARPLVVGSWAGLVAVLSRRTACAWTIAVASTSSLLVAMGGGTVRVADEGGISGGFLGSQMAGVAPALGFLRYVGTIVASLVAAQIVAGVNAAARDERRGVTAVVRSLGVGRIHASWARCGGALVAGSVTLLVSATACAVTADLMFGLGVWQAASSILDRFPGIALSGAVAVVAVSFRPVLAPAGWLVVAAGAAAAFLGPLAGLPREIVDVTPFAEPHVGSAVVFLSLALALLAAGWVEVRRRDVLGG